MQALQIVGGLIAAVVFAVAIAATAATPQARVRRRLDDGVSTVRATWEHPLVMVLFVVPVVAAVLILTL